ncbi:MAG: cobyrinate a,c-diamide synthase, partial [Methanomethylophilus sp.]
SGDGDLGSTAYIAKLLGFPVVLVVNAGSLNRSAAAVVNGFRAFDPQVNIAGVILNNVSGQQHSDKLDTVMETYCPGLSVLGKVRKDREHTLGQRYLGLKTLHSFSRGEIEPLETLTDPIDLDLLMGLAEKCTAELSAASPFVQRRAGLKAAVPVDDAYCFYYRENLECLAASGVQVQQFRPVDGDPFPDADLAYLGGGYPELYAEQIARNSDFREGLKQLAAEGRPVLGECGGLMTLCRTITDRDGRSFPMAGVFDAEARMTGVRHGPTYVMAEAVDNPLFKGAVRGHEYHYSDVIPADGAHFVFDVKRGLGIQRKRDGLCVRNAVGTYMHQHALSADDWAAGLVAAAQQAL